MSRISDANLTYQSLHIKAMKEAVDRALETVHARIGGPFGASIYKNGQCVAVASNSVLTSRDCTCHAEMNCLRIACQVLNTDNLSDCDLYSTAEPCPMCYAASLLFKIRRIYVGVNRKIASNYGFDDEEFYIQISLPFEKRSMRTEVGILECEILRECFLKVPTEDKFDVKKTVSPEILRFIREAIAICKVSPCLNLNDVPYASPTAVIVVKDKAIIGLGVSSTHWRKDITKAAGIVAIQRACDTLGSHLLSGCRLYSIVELSVLEYTAALWARIEGVYCGISLEMAYKYGNMENPNQYKEFGSTGADKVVFGVLADECEQVFLTWRSICGILY